MINFKTVEVEETDSGEFTWDEEEDGDDEMGTSDVDSE